MEGNDGDTQSHYPDLSKRAIRALATVIVTSLLGIITLSAWGLALRYGVAGNGPETGAGGTSDEALSVLGNIAAAAVGGLAGWLTRDIIVWRTPPAEERLDDSGTDNRLEKDWGSE